MLERERIWRRNNRERYNAYMRKWRSEHKENVADYNAKRRRPPLVKNCQQCGGQFQTKSGAQKFCSPRCRSKMKNSQPEHQKKNRLRAKLWRNNNREKCIENSKTWYRTRYKQNTLKSMRAQPWASLLKSRKRFSLAKGLTFELDANWAAARWTGKCEVTGLDFAPPERRTGYKNRNFSPSIDKIDPAKGYTKDNCRFVLLAVNSLKRDGPDSDMYKIAGTIMSPVPLNATTVLSLPE
jgi:hypothetical protein